MTNLQPDAGLQILPEFASPCIAVVVLKRMPTRLLSASNGHRPFFAPALVSHRRLGSSSYRLTTGPPTLVPHFQSMASPTISMLRSSPAGRTRPSGSRLSILSPPQPRISCRNYALCTGDQVGASR